MAENIRMTDTITSDDDFLARVKHAANQLRAMHVRWDEGDEQVDVQALAAELADAACELPQTNAQNPEVIKRAVQLAAAALLILRPDEEL